MWKLSPGVCCRNVGSCKSDVRQHCKTIHHTRKVWGKIAGSQRLWGVQLLQCITDYKGVVSSQTDGQEPDGFALVPERRLSSSGHSCRILQEMIREGIELQKTKKIRGCLERHMSSIPLTMTIRNRQYNLQWRTEIVIRRLHSIIHGVTV